MFYVCKVNLIKEKRITTLSLFFPPQNKPSFHFIQNIITEEEEEEATNFKGIY